MLWGGIAGDVIGSRFEAGCSKLTPEFELFHNDCKFTDDTVLIVALAHTWLEEQDWPTTLRAYANKYPHAGYGGNFVKWVRSSLPFPYNSYGNGSACRVAPVAYAAQNWQQALELAKLSAEITHNHPEGIKGAQAVAAAMFLARQQESKNVIREAIQKTFQYNMARSYERVRRGYSFKVSCQESVPESIICFLESDSWEDAVRRAVNLRGDTDTMASIAGSIAEAYYGVPQDIVEATRKYLPEEMILVVDKFNETIK
jgi:ADP-ribosylglycohydrolase